MPLPTNKQVWEAVSNATKRLPVLHRAMAQLDMRQRKCKPGSTLYNKLEADIEKYRREAEECSMNATGLVWHKMNGPTFNEPEKDSQDSQGYDVDETGQRIDSDHNMFLRQDLAAMYGECPKCNDPLNSDGICPAGCNES